jgi:hypothetical protein
MSDQPIDRPADTPVSVPAAREHRGRRRVRTRVRIKVDHEGHPLSRWKRIREKLPESLWRNLLMAIVVILGAIALWFALHVFVKDPPLPVE